MSNTVSNTEAKTPSRGFTCQCNRYQKIMISHLRNADTTLSDQPLADLTSEQCPTDDASKCPMPNEVCKFESCTCRANISEDGTMGIFAKLRQVLLPDALTIPIGASDKDCSLKIHGHWIHYNLTAEARARYQNMTPEARANCLKKRYGVEESFKILNPGGETNPKHDKWLKGVRDGIRKEMFKIATTDQEERAALSSKAAAWETEVHEDMEELWNFVGNHTIKDTAPSVIQDDEQQTAPSVETSLVANKASKITEEHCNLVCSLVSKVA